MSVQFCRLCAVRGRVVRDCPLCHGTNKMVSRPPGGTSMTRDEVKAALLKEAELAAGRPLLVGSAAAKLAQAVVVALTNDKPGADFLADTASAYGESCPKE